MKYKMHKNYMKIILKKKLKNGYLTKVMQTFKRHGKQNGELIGDTGINEVDGKPNEVEIGYTICKEYSGNGYATELVQGMTRFACETFKVKILYGRVMHGNNASVRVLDKNAYSFVSEEFDADDDPYGKGMLIYKKEC